jgi:hypothetical protein
MGINDETSALLRRLERAVGLAALATATMGFRPMPQLFRTIYGL